MGRTNQTTEKSAEKSPRKKVIKSKAAPSTESAGTVATPKKSKVGAPKKPAKKTTEKKEVPKRPREKKELTPEAKEERNKKARLRRREKKRQELTKVHQREETAVKKSIYKAINVPKEPVINMAVLDQMLAAEKDLTFSVAARTQYHEVMKACVQVVIDQTMTEASARAVRSQFKSLPVDPTDIVNAINDPDVLPGLPPLPLGTDFARRTLIPRKRRHRKPKAEVAA